MKWACIGEKTLQIKLGAPEFWCPGTRSLVPFQADQQFFVLISRMGFRALNFSCLPSVSMCSTQNLVLSEHGQHEWACSEEKTRKKMWGQQSSGARAPELWCPLSSWLIIKFFNVILQTFIPIFILKISSMHDNAALATFTNSRLKSSFLCFYLCLNKT